MPAPTTKPFEIWEDHAATVRFCFSYISDAVTTGAVMIKANFELPQHTYASCSQSLTQLAGQCSVIIFGKAGEILAVSELGPGDCLDIAAGTTRLITNVSEEESVTLFALKGETQDVIEHIRRIYVSIDRSPAQKA
jgi:uncharacterized RmlC-like cupin family protein